MRKKLTSTTALVFASLSLLNAGCPDGGKGTDPDAGLDAGPKPPEFQACSGDIDNAIDGTLDDKWTFLYDDKAFPTKDELDRGRDGTVDEIDEWGFDAHGNFTSYVAKNIAADGTAKVYYQQTEVYSDKDLLLERLIRMENQDGTPPYIRLNKYSYDAAGKAVDFTTDKDADGTIDSKTTYVYDGGAYYIRTETDSGLDGTINSVTKYARNAAGRVTQEDFDFSNNGSIDLVIAFTYDAAGHVLDQVETMPNDPAYETAFRSTYDAMGRAETYTFTASDTPETNAKTTYVYGCGNGRSHARRMFVAGAGRSEAQRLLRQVRAGRELE